jgi:hypothetical protein
MKPVPDEYTLNPTVELSALFQLFLDVVSALCQSRSVVVGVMGIDCAVVVLLFIS